MKLHIINILLAFTLLTTLVSCKKEEAGSTAPTLEVVSVSKTAVIEFTDSLIVTLKYEDVNGDLGQTNPDDNGLSVQDNRMASPDFYHIPPITPELDKLNTAGTFQVFIPSLFLLGNGGFEKTTFSFKVRDRDGNWSNLATTPEIGISR